MDDPEPTTPETEEPNLLSVLTEVKAALESHEARLKAIEAHFEQVLHVKL